jgi:putative FmdB family regulatory protein
VPLYEYRCTKCNHTFEKIRKFSDPPLTECPKCAAPIEQLMSAPAIQFKGAGWYVNDYAKKSGPSGASKNGSDVSSSSSDSKSETKPDSKPDSSSSSSKSESKSDSTSSSSSDKK